MWAPLIALIEIFLAYLKEPHHRTVWFQLSLCLLNENNFLSKVLVRKNNIGNVSPSADPLITESVAIVSRILDNNNKNTIIIIMAMMITIINDNSGT